MEEINICSTGVYSIYITFEDIRELDEKKNHKLLVIISRLYRKKNFNNKIYYVGEFISVAKIATTRGTLKPILHLPAIRFLIFSMVIT